MNPLSVSALAAPAPPLGFEVDIYYDTTQVLNPLGVYLCAVDFMYLYAQSGWYKQISGGFTVWVAGFNVEIDIENSQGPQGSLQLQTNHVVLGLYDTITDVAAHSRFCKVLVTLSLHRRQIGSLVIEEKTPQGSGKGEAVAANPALGTVSSPSNAVTYPSGEITDRDDISFSISYTYSGTNINSRDIILAVLDALATAAQSAPGTPFRSLDAKSVSGICLLSMLQVENPLFKVNYSYVTKALRTIILDIMVPLRKFGEMTVQLNWEAVKMAEGSIRLADAAMTVASTIDA